MPYMGDYNLNVQQQINSHTMVQLSYVGRKATGCGDSST